MPITIEDYTSRIWNRQRQEYDEFPQQRAKTSSIPGGTYSVQCRNLQVQLDTDDIRKFKPDKKAAFRYEGRVYLAVVDNGGNHHRIYVNFENFQQFIDECQELMQSEIRRQIDQKVADLNANRRTLD